MVNTANLGHFGYAVPSGNSVPRGEYTFTVGETVKIAHIERVRQRSDRTWFIEGTFWPAALYGMLGNLGEATFLH